MGGKKRKEKEEFSRIRNPAGLCQGIFPSLSDFGQGSCGWNHLDLLDLLPQTSLNGGRSFPLGLETESTLLRRAVHTTDLTPVLATSRT